MISKPKLDKMVFCSEIASNPINFRSDHCVLELLTRAKKLDGVRGPATGNEVPKLDTKSDFYIQDTHLSWSCKVSGGH